MLKKRSRAMRCYLSLLVFVSITSLGGCANDAAIYRPLHLGEGNGVLVDAKQRAIYAGRTLPGSKANEREGVVCPEPSPDAISALASSGALSSDKLGLELALARQESAAYIGVRTATIQLLRDQLTFNCLDYMNGIIDSAQYDFRVRRTQRYTIALLAVEQLTGAMRAQGGSAVAVATAEARDQSLNLQIKAMGDELKILQAERDKPGITDEKKKEFDGKIAALTKEISDLQVKAKAVPPTKVGSAGSAESSSVNAGLSIMNSSVATVVEKIAMQLITTDDAPGLCLAHISKLTQEEIVSQTLFTKICLKELKFTDEAKAIVDSNTVGQAPDEPMPAVVAPGPPPEPESAARVAPPGLPPRFGILASTEAETKANANLEAAEAEAKIRAQYAIKISAIAKAAAVAAEAAAKAAAKAAADAAGLISPAAR